MKRLFVTAFLLISAVCHAQIIRDYTEIFDSVFLRISRIDASTGILYNRVIPFSNVSSYNSLINGILCFIFGICGENNWGTEEILETRAAKANNRNFETSSLAVYPNPADNILFIELSNSVVEKVSICDLHGKVIKSTEDCASINVSNIHAGVYIVRVADEEGNFYYQKFVKK